MDEPIFPGLGAAFEQQQDADLAGDGTIGHERKGRPLSLHAWMNRQPRGTNLAGFLTTAVSRTVRIKDDSGPQKPLSQPDRIPCRQAA